MRVSKKRPKKTKSKSMADKLRRAFRSTNAFRVEDPVAAVRFLEANNPNSIAKPAARTLLSVLQKLQRRPDDHRSRNLSFAPLIHRKFITGVRGAADILHLAGYTEKKDGMPSYTLAKFKPKRVSAVIAALKSGIARMRSIAAPMKKASLSDIGALAMGDIKQIREIFEEKKSGITEEAPSLEAQEDEGGVFGVGGEGKASRARGKIREMAEGVSLAVRKAREAKSSLGQKLGTFTFGYWGQVVPLSQCPGDHAEIIRQVRKLTGGLATGDEVPHGYGIAIDPLGSTYEGQFHYGKPEGYGRRRLVVGVTQEGEFQNGELEGFGRQLNADENGRPAAFKYVGSFKKGNKSGYAEFSGPNGLLYKGEYLNNDFHGLGFMTRSNGKHEYYGEYKNGQNEGVGVLTEGAERTKIKYWGQFKLGVPHGHGVTSKGANDDEVYEGQFFGGMQHRSGVLKVNHPQEADGPFVLYGGFKQGQPHGYGSVLFGGNVKSFRGKVFRQPVSGASMRFNKGAMEETDQHEVPMVSKAIENARKAQQQAQRFKAEALRAAARAKAKVEKESLTVSTPATKEEKTASQWRQHLQAAKRKIRALRAFKDGRKLSEKRKQSCAECGRKLGIFGFECRCLRKFCEKHRLPASHACPFDMKRFHRNRLKSESEKLQTNRGLEDVI
uniref:AN1-type domain-containing protein n=3 Tax=Lotharella globosa TaxID=91324 RepID=A0A7S4DSH1_9EUKA